MSKAKKQELAALFAEYSRLLKLEDEIIKAHNSQLFALRQEREKVYNKWKAAGGKIL